MLRSPWPILALALVSLLCFGCSKATDSARPDELRPEPLRIGITPSYPPMIFEMEGRIAGVEADLARMMGAALGRSIQFVPLRWDALIPALMEGKIDIVMSGMSITPARKVRVDFCEPYFEGGLLAAMRTEDANTYASTESVLECAGNVGVVPETTADVFVRENLPRARRLAVSDPADAAFDLKQKRIDLFLADSPTVVWLVSENEADLTALWKPLDTEKLAWAVRRGNGEMLETANRLLRSWKENGALQQVLERWLPYLADRG